MAKAINRALTMPAEEQADRMRLLREMIRDNNVYCWAARILLDAAHLRKRSHIERFIAETPDNSEDINNVVTLQPGRGRPVS